MIAAVLSLLLILSSLPAGHDRAEAANGKLKITATSLNVRQGPGLSYPIAGSVRKGEQYPILKESGDWIKISLGRGKEGWVAEWFTEKLGNDPSPGSAISNSDTGKVTANGLRVRKGPGTNFSIIGSLNNGQSVKILSTSGQWIQISSESLQGWVSGEYLRTSSTEIPGKSSSTTKTKNTATISADSLNVRDHPSLNARTIGSLKKGTIVEIFEQSNGWTSITYSGRKAWVSSQFLNQAGTGTKDKVSSGQYTGMVTASTLNVRERNSLNSKIVGSVSKGQSFQILDEQNNWMKIEYRPGKTGWAAAWFFDKKQSGPAIPPKQTTQKSIVKILENGTNIRKGPSTATAVIRRANQGELYPVRSLKKDWYEISLPDGKIGYVAGWIVTVAGNAQQVEKPGAEKHIKNKTVIIDPGHGGRDNGTTGVRGTLEKTLTLKTAQSLYDKLKASGTNVILTRNHDSYLSLGSRVSTAHYHNADAFISLHYDSINDRSIRGMTTYYYHSSQKPLGKEIHSAVINRTMLKDRGTRFGDYHVIRENRQKSVLIELGYLSNPAEEMLVNSPQYQEKVASGISEGLARYFKNN